MSLEEAGNVPGKIGKWLAITSAALTIILTAYNGYLSSKVSQAEHEIEKRAQDLETKRLMLDAGKEDINRYAFVQNLLSGVLTQNQAEKNLTINLINLALTEQEAKQLFAGLQASNDNETRIVGSLGSEVVAISNLVLQMNDATKDNRVGAVEVLIKNYRGNSAAVEQAVSLLEPPKLDGLSASGRINVLVFLNNTEAMAWTPQSITRAEKAIDQIRLRATNGVKIGTQTDAALKQLSKHLNIIKG